MSCMEGALSNKISLSQCSHCGVLNFFHSVRHSGNQGQSHSKLCYGANGPILSSRKGVVNPHNS